MHIKPSTNCIEIYLFLCSIGPFPITTSKCVCVFSFLLRCQYLANLARKWFPLIFSCFFFLSAPFLTLSLSLSWDRFRLSADQNGPSSNWYVGPIYKLNTRMNSFKISSIFDDFSFLPKLCAIRLFGQAGLLMSLKLVLFSLFLYVCVCDFVHHEMKCWWRRIMLK